MPTLCTLLLTVQTKLFTVLLFYFRSECEQLRAEVLSRGAAQLASAAQVRDLRRKLALLTAGNARTNSTSPAGDVKNDNKVENSLSDRVTIGMPKVNVQVRSKATSDDVKKKVSFN